MWRRYFDGTVKTVVADVADPQTVRVPWGMPTTAVMSAAIRYVAVPMTARTAAMSPKRRPR